MDVKNKKQEELKPYAYYKKRFLIWGVIFIAVTILGFIFFDDKIVLWGAAIPCGMAASNIEKMQKIRKKQKQPYSRIDPE